MIAAGVIGGVFVVCTLVMFLGVKEKDGESKTRNCQPLQQLINNSNVFTAQQQSAFQNRRTMTAVVPKNNPDDVIRT